MKLLAIDQASVISGWAVFEDKTPILYGKIDLHNESNDLGERLVILRNEIKKLIEENNIDYVAFEDIQMQISVGNNVQTFKVLASVFGNIMELLTEMKIPYFVVPSVRWKSTLGIKGKKRPEQKQNAQAYVKATYGIEAIQDTVDAICIGAHIVNTERLEGISWADE